MDIEEITTSDERYQWIEDLMLSAFPEDERRDTDAQRANVDGESRFHCCIAMDSGTPVGLFCYWDLGDFCYCEHFATDPAMRNCGYGSRILTAVLERMGKPLVLEVELPEDDFSRRRIGFYSRHGLRLWEEQEYIQPPYRPGGKPLPLMLMATAGLDPEKDYAIVRDLIHNHVYGVDRRAGGGIV